MDLEEGNYMWETPADEKHYEWQLSVAQQWLRIDNDHVIETHYCQPGAKGITISTTHGQVFIDFDKLQTTNSGMNVQRRTLLPQGQTEDVGWYYKDDQLWREYGSQGTSVLSASVNSGDVERQFALNPQGSFSFTVGTIGYRLDFPTMVQTNSSSGMRRKVRRRPKFKSDTGSLHATSGLLSPFSSLLSDGRFKWEFMGDEGVWTEYQAHACSFDSAAIERQYQQDPGGQLRFRAGRFSYTLDFSAMHQVNDSIGTRRAVRRTAHSQQNSSWGTPRWQFQDIDGIWQDYSKKNHRCSMSSQDIEVQYQQNPSGTTMFTTKSFNYELNFSAMTQRNLSTNTTRSVRRLNQ